MKFWAALGSQGYREKKLPNCHKYATSQGMVFSTFGGENFFFFFLRNIVASALKSYLIES